MKKIFYTLGLMFVALTLSNCTVNEENQITPDETKGSAFELIASTATRTAADGVTTAWVAADEINVFHAVAGTTIADATDCVNDGKFTIAAEDVATGRFTGTLAGTLSKAAYDWYVYYPYISYFTAPIKSGYTTVVPTAITQSGNNSQAHISGLNAHLYGKATNVAKGTSPSIQMKHVTTLMKINVTNSSADAIIIDKIELTCTQDIAGSFYVDFAGDEFKFDAKSSAKTVTLTVNNGAEIAAAGQASFYIAVKPFTTVSGNELTIKITPKVGASFSKTKTFDSAVEFAAGNVNNLNIAYAPPVFVPAAYVLAGSIAAGDEILIASVYNNIWYTMGGQTNTAYTAYRDYLATTVVDNVLTSTNEMRPLTVGEGSTGKYTLYDAVEPGYLGYTGTSTNLSTQPDAYDWTITFVGTTASIYETTNPSTSSRILCYNSGAPRFACYATATKTIIQASIFKKSTATVISASDQSVAYSAANGVEVPFTVVNKSGNVTAVEKTDDHNMISNVAVDETNGKITFDIAENSGSAARTAVITISNNSVDKDVTITQAAAPTKLLLQNLTCSTQNETSLVFTWTTNTDSDGYKVSTDGGSTYGETQTAATYTWSGLTAATAYTLYVKAIGDGIYDVDSDAVSASGTTLAPMLSQPTDITWAQGTKTVSWTDANSALTYGTDYKYVYTLGDDDNEIDATSSTTAVLTITETTAIKIKAVALTSTHRTSEFTAPTSCLIGSQKYYVKVTSAPADWSGTYLIVFDTDDVHAKISGKDLATTIAGVSTSGDKIVSNATTDAESVIIASYNTGYSIKLPSTKYLSCNANENQSAETIDAFAFTLAYVDSGISISGVDTRGNKRYLYKNDIYYRFYKSNDSYVLPVLFKLED